MTSTAALAVQIYTTHKLGLAPDEKQAGAMQWMHDNPEISGALLGGGIGALSGLGKDENGKRKVLRNALIGAGIGGVGGMGYRGLMHGQEAPKYDPETMFVGPPAPTKIGPKAPKYDPETMFVGPPAPTKMGPNPLDFPKEEGSAPNPVPKEDTASLQRAKDEGKAQAHRYIGRGMERPSFAPGELPPTGAGGLPPTGAGDNDWKSQSGDRSGEKDIQALNEAPSRYANRSLAALSERHMDLDGRLQAAEKANNPVAVNLLRRQIAKLDELTEGRYRQAQTESWGTSAAQLAAGAVDSVKDTGKNIAGLPGKTTDGIADWATDRRLRGGEAQQKQIEEAIESERELQELYRRAGISPE